MIALSHNNMAVKNNQTFIFPAAHLAISFCLNAPNKHRDV